MIGRLQAKAAYDVLWKIGRLAQTAHYGKMENDCLLENYRRGTNIPRMNIVVWVIGFLAVAVLGGLLALFKYSADPWRRTLHEYQSVVGSLVTMFAAGVALIGVWLTVSAQLENTDRQLTEQRMQFREELREGRAAEDRGRAIRRQQIASAFLGEIYVITARFRTPDWRDTATKALDIAKRVQSTGGGRNLADERAYGRLRDIFSSKFGCGRGV